MTSLVPSFLVGASSFLLVTRTTIKTWISFKFKENQPQTVELTALEHHKNLHRLTKGDLL